MTKKWLIHDWLDGLGCTDHTTTTANSCLTEKWSGGVHLVLNCPVEAAWAIQSDFLGLTKWVPTVSISECVEGENNIPGCLRYCKGTGTTWVHERLLEFDNAHKCMSYRMEKNQFVFRDGFQNYVSKVKVKNDLSLSLYLSLFKKWMKSFLLVLSNILSLC